MAEVPGTAGQDFHENVPVTLYHLQIVRYITVAALSFNIWDFSISLFDEIYLVWMAPLSWVKCLFLLNRYLGPSILIVNVSVLFAKDVTDSVCRNWFRLEGWGGLIVVVVVQVILVLRVTALYERNAIVNRALALGLVGNVSACVTILGLGLEQIQPIRHLSSIPIGCVTDRLPRFLFGLFIPHLVMESTLFSLTAVQSLKNLPKDSWYSTPLLMLLLRDGTTYFFAMFVVTCTTTFTWLFAPPSLMKISVAPLIAISSVSGCRIILNLRALHRANDKIPVLQLSLATLDLGDLEMRTLPRMTKTACSFGNSTDIVPRTPHLPPSLPEMPDASSKGHRLGEVVDVELDLEDFRSRTTTTTISDDYDHFPTNHNYGAGCRVAANLPHLVAI